MQTVASQIECSIAVKERERNNLTLLPPPLANLCRETSLDSGDGAPRSARVAGNKIQTVFALVQIGIGRATRFARDVFYNVPPEHILDLLLLETTLDDQAARSVDGTGCTQLSEQELSHMLVRSLHPLGDLGNVREDGLALR
jgi:hypothetical protein